MISILIVFLFCWQHKTSRVSVYMIHFGGHGAVHMCHVLDSCHRLVICIFVSLNVRKEIKPSVYVTSFFSAFPYATFPAVFGTWI